MRPAILAILLLTARVAAASADYAVAEEEPALDEPIEVDAVSSSVAAVPRPAVAPKVQREGDRLIVGCVELRMVPDYDGHSILALTIIPDCEP